MVGTSLIRCPTHAPRCATRIFPMPVVSSSARNADRTRVRAHRISDGHARIDRCLPVKTPFADIAQRVVEPPVVRLQQPDDMHVSVLAPFVARPCRIPGDIRGGIRGFVGDSKSERAPRARHIFPLSLCRQVKKHMVLRLGTKFTDDARGHHGMSLRRPIIVSPRRHGATQRIG